MLCTRDAGKMGAGQPRLVSRRLRSSALQREACAKQSRKLKDEKRKAKRLTVFDNLKKLDIVEKKFAEANGQVSQLFYQKLNLEDDEIRFPNNIGEYLNQLIKMFHFFYKFIRQRQSFLK